MLTDLQPILTVGRAPNRAIHIYSRTGALPPDQWGIVLVDVARHIAQCLHPDDTRAQAEALLEIWKGLEAERATPTDWPRPG